MKTKITTLDLVRWLLLLPAVVLADYLAHAVMQLVFPWLEHRLLPPGVDINDLSIMDEERIFGPYGQGLFSCLAVFAVYLLAPRWKMIVVTVVVLFMAPFYFGVASVALGVIVGAALGLVLAMVVDHFTSRNTFDDKGKGD